MEDMTNFDKLAKAEQEGLGTQEDLQHVLSSCICTWILSVVLRYCISLLISGGAEGSAEILYIILHFSVTEICEFGLSFCSIEITHFIQADYTTETGKFKTTVRLI